MNTRRVGLSASALPIARTAWQVAFSQSAVRQEVVVTARKGEANIFEIPVSVSALSEGQVDRAGISNPEDLSSCVSGLLFEASTSTGGRANPSIRMLGLNQQISTPSTQVGAGFWDGSCVGGAGGLMPTSSESR